MPAAPAITTKPRFRLAAALGALTAFVALVAVFAGIGGPHDHFAGLGRVIDLVLTAGWAPALYLLSSYGLGHLFDPLTRESHHRPALRMSLGLGLLLTLTHALATFGVLDVKTLAAVVLIPGLTLLISAAARQRPTLGVSPWTLTWIPAIALLLVAASNPPGILWLSEGRGYDALSYHLQLPQDWLLLGGLRPVEHNVYSFLPSYIEAAFYHLGLLMGAEPPAPGATRAWGLTAGGGEALIACQYFSVCIAVTGAWITVSLTSALLVRCGFDERTRTPISLLTGAVILSTPWTIVIGSLAYNDLAVVALAGAGVLAAIDPSLSPARRGLLTGFLVGLACSAKPTALFLAAPPAGVLLLGTVPPRRWLATIGCGTLTGLLALAPWLLRNWIHAGNPVFPQASGIFGAAHWTQEQLARYAAAHSPESLLGGLGQMLSPGGRGLLHFQWLAYFPLCFLGGAIALLNKPTRRIATLLLTALALQLAAWLLLTHVQSRFLIPLVLSSAPLFAIGLAVLVSRFRRALLLGILAALAQLVGSILLFAAETRSNQPLIAGPSAITGELFRSLPPSPELAAGLSPQGYLNRHLPPTARVYLLSESRPLYFAVPTLYNTTWDRWPLGNAIRRHPGDPASWAGELRAEGITHILYNAAELARLRASGRIGAGGWADPLITPELVQGFLEQRTRPVRSWPEAGIGLYELLPADGAPSP